MRADDPVLGLSLHDKSWAIPWWIIKNHHVANLTIDGQPVVITFCEVCSSGAAFDPVVDGRRLSFRFAGMYNGSILMSDYETGTYWGPFTGEGLEGPLKGTKLVQFELLQGLWKEWLELYPNSLVGYGPQQLREGHSAGMKPGGPETSFLYLLVKPLDKRLDFNEPVLGVGTREARAYPLGALDRSSDTKQKIVVVNDTVENQEILVVHTRGSWLTTTFSRTLAGMTLRFVVDRDGRITDTTYHSHWSQRGEALDGPLAGRKLSYFPSKVEEWYIWAAYHPTTSIFPGAPDAPPVAE